MPSWTHVLPALALLLLLLQNVIEGIRWHMVPAYVVTISLFLTWSWPREEFLSGSWTVLCGIGLLLGAAILGTVFPVFELPKPTGAYPIGTVTAHRIDSAREKPQGHRPAECRELMIQIWYPAERSGPGQAYRTRAETSFTKKHLALVRTHAATGAAVASLLPRYPVVIFSPSWTGRRNQNTVQAEELASHGFVVVGIDHPFGTDLTIFPDGRIARTTLDKPLDYSTDEALEASIRSTEAELRLRAADVRFVLDVLERLDRSDPEGLLTGRVDTSRVGIFGHSFGGAIAAEVCLIDPRFQAGINLDGLIFGGPTTHRIGKPFLFLCDDTPIPTLEALQNSSGPVHRELAFIAQNAQCIRQFLPQAHGCWLTIRGSAHMNFCDSPLYSPVKRWTRAGPIRRARAMEIINTYVVSFFQAHLNGIDDPLFDAPACRYPEVVHMEIPGDAMAHRNEYPSDFVAENV